MGALPPITARSWEGGGERTSDGAQTATLHTHNHNNNVDLQKTIDVYLLWVDIGGDKLSIWFLSVVCTFPVWCAYLLQPIEGFQSAAATAFQRTDRN